MKYEDLVPVVCEEHSWSVNEQNHVVVQMKNRGNWWNLSRKNKRKRNSENDGYNKDYNGKRYEVELDDYGSYVWKKIDGKRSNISIIEEIQRELGEDVNLATQRLVMFMHMLKKNRMIYYMKK